MHDVELRYSFVGYRGLVKSFASGLPIAMSGA
jgi:hypothetical protein